MKKLSSIFLGALLAFSGALFAHSGEDHGDKDKTGDSEATITVKGEIVDLVCYVDHGATGEKHADCAATCISGGLPVGLKAADGKLYTVVGDHKAINKELAKYAGKQVTLRGKVASKDGVTLLENVEVVK
jgi:hypothetical protein